MTTDKGYWSEHVGVAVTIRVWVFVLPLRLLGLTGFWAVLVTLACLFWLVAGFICLFAVSHIQIVLLRDSISRCSLGGSNAKVQMVHTVSLR